MNFQVKVFIELNDFTNFFYFCSFKKIWGLLKIQKSRLATDEKAEFTSVNEHFEEGA